MAEQYGFYVDTSRCIKCWACVVACKQWHEIDAGTVSRRNVTETVEGTFPDVKRKFESLSCMHCENPLCMANCPQGAISKREEDGAVVVDDELCIGCKTCISACPYGAPSYDEETSTTFKCDGCYDRRQRGELPACVAACPGANIALDEMDALQSTYEADIVSDEKSGTRPNFVITVDANLAEEPDDLVVEARTA